MTLSPMAAKYPLPVTWQVTLGDMAFIRHAPVAVNGAVLVRVDGDVFRVALSDGTVDKRTTFDKGRGRGKFWQPHGDVVLTDATLRDRSRSELVCVDHAGAIRWQTLLSVVLSAAPVSADDTYVRVCGQDYQSGNKLVSLTLDSGAVEREIAVGHGVSSWLSHGEGALVSHMGNDGWGLYVVDAEGNDQTKLAEQPMWWFGTTEALVVGVLKPSADGGAFPLRALDRDSLDLAWTADLACAACTIDGEELVAVAPGPAGPVPAMFDVATGQRRWTAATPLSAMPSVATLAGPLVFFRGGLGVSVYRRSDGEFLREIPEFGAAAVVVDGQLVLGGSENLICAPTSELLDVTGYTALP